MILDGLLSMHMYHGGWKNASTVDHFVEFSRLMFNEIGRKVSLKCILGDYTVNLQKWVTKMAFRWRADCDLR